MTTAPDPAAVGGIPMGAIPRQQRGIDMRDRLFAAMVGEVEREGIDGARVERVLEELETSWGTFHRYFRRKEDVLLLYGVRHFRGRVRPVIDAGLRDDARPRREIAREAVAALTRPPGSARLHAEALAEAARFPLRFAAMLDEGELPLIAVFTALVADAQERREVRPDIPAPVCATVLSAGVMFSAVQILRGAADGRLDEALVDRVPDLAFEAAWGGIEAR